MAADVEHSRKTTGFMEGRDKPGHDDLGESPESNVDWT
jgi:hypothetical protein